MPLFFFFSSRRRHTRSDRDWSSDVCSSDLVMGGEPVSFASIRDAASHGIGIVFQELNLCPNLSVTENIFLGRDLTKAGFHIDRAAQRKRAGELLARLEHGIDPDSLVGELMIGEQQIV